MSKLLLLLGVTLSLNLWDHRASAQSLKNDHTILEEPGVENAYPRLARDNSKVLYQSNRSGKWQLYIRDLASGKDRRVTTDGFNNNFPDWSPDNQTIAFVSDRDGNEELYLVNTDGSGLRRLTTDKERDIHPYFSPDGRYLLFNSTRSNGSLDIFRYNLSSGKTEQLTNTPGDNETCARYNRSMDRIVFLRNNDHSDDVFVLNMNNGLPENVSGTPVVMDGWPMFSTDGAWIYFSSMESGRYSLHRVRTDGTGKTQLSFPGPGEEDARVYLGMDNRTIVYNKKTGKTIEIRKAELL